QLPLIRSNDALVGDWVHVFGAGSVLNVRAGYSEFLELSRSDEALGFDATTLGLPASLVSQLPGHLFPRIELSGDSYVNLSRGANQATSKIWSLQPNVSLTKGQHNIRSGLDMRQTTVERRNLDFGAMQIVFDRTFTQRDFATPETSSGSPVASLLLGAPIRGVIDNNVQPDFTWSFFAPWVQDDWKVSAKLALNIGLRWDFSGPVGEEQDRLNYSFDPTLLNPVTSRIDQTKFPGYQVKGGLSFAGVDGNPVNPWKYDKNNVQFRGGFAFQVDDKTVVRGGYGRYFLNPAREPYP